MMSQIEYRSLCGCVNSEVLSKTEMTSLRAMIVALVILSQLMRALTAAWLVFLRQQLINYFNYFNGFILQKRRRLWANLPDSVEGQGKTEWRRDFIILILQPSPVSLQPSFRVTFQYQVNSIILH